jgi:SAM-dependent methyltransferase
MPFASGSFDLVLNRHSGLNGAEVARILAPGGVFFTQQIHGLWTHDLLAEFGATPQWSDAIPEATVSMLETAELRIVNVEVWQGDLTFHDVGAIVYYLMAVPWLVPGFSVETHMDTLMRLQGQLQREGPLVYEARKYLIEAEKAG